ncbi:hypothetical protein Tco_0347168 [Tanacetum coccineum]
MRGWSGWRGEIAKKISPEKMEARRKNPLENFFGGGGGGWPKKREMGESIRVIQARNADPLALVTATQQPTYNPQPKPTYYTQTLTNRSPAATRSKGKEIAKAPSPPESYHEVVSDEEETHKDKEI